MRWNYGPSRAEREILGVIRDVLVGYLDSRPGAPPRTAPTYMVSTNARTGKTVMETTYLPRPMRATWTKGDTLGRIKFTKNSSDEFKAQAEDLRARGN
jgi:hypothetical protein